MKTPKRIFDYPSDPNADISALSEREATQHARWKRKNKERQYKSSITKFVAWAWAWKREYEKLKADVLKTAKDVQRILDGAEPYMDAVEHTACHEIEGS